MAPTRRDALGLIGAGLAAPAHAARSDLAERFAALERQSGGRIGVAALDTWSGRRIRYRDRERFPMCSTFKLLLVSAVLSRVDRGEEQLDRPVAITKADLQPNSPGTATHVGESMSVAALCEPAIIYSDNTAANLLLGTIGGPRGVTRYARSLGDRMTRLDRWETELNRVGPGDPRDTTTPAAMLEDLRKLLFGRALSPASRERLAGWLAANRTGDDRLRAGVPKDWRVGDKTGAWLPDGGINDIGILWPPRRPAILVTAYTVGSPKDFKTRSAVIAEIGRVVASSL